VSDLAIPTKEEVYRCRGAEAINTLTAYCIDMLARIRFLEAEVERLVNTRSQRDRLLEAGKAIKIPLPTRGLNEAVSHLRSTVAAVEKEISDGHE
jgi:uncharacterized small protein (DUF1192 family)